MWSSDFKESKESSGSLVFKQRCEARVLDIDEATMGVGIEISTSCLTSMAW